MSSWQPISTVPKNRKHLFWVKFADNKRADGCCVGKWAENGRGFRLKMEFGTWHERGVVAWMPFPKGPRLPLSPNGGSDHG